MEFTKPSLSEIAPSKISVSVTSPPKNKGEDICEGQLILIKLFMFSLK